MALTKADLEKFIRGLESDLRRLRQLEKDTGEDYSAQIAVMEADLRKSRADLERVVDQERRDQARGQRDANGRPVPAWVRNDDGSYSTRDGRRVFFDGTTGTYRVEKSAGRGAGDDVIVVGLYTDPKRADRVVRGHRIPGAQVTPVNNNPIARAQAESRARTLRLKARQDGLTAAEAAELNRLEAALAGTYIMSLGLQGSGKIRDARDMIISRDARGREYISVFGEQRRLKASVTGIYPRTREGWAQWQRTQQQLLTKLRGDIANLDQRISAIQAGLPDPRPFQTVRTIQ